MCEKMESFNVNIYQIKLRNFEIYDKLDLEFIPQESTIFLSPIENNNKLTNIIDSIKFIVHPYYLNRNNAKKHLKENCEDGSVEIKFIDMDSSQTYFAKRSFSKINYIEWTTTSKSVELIPLYQFHNKYFPATECYGLEIDNTPYLLQSFIAKIWKAYDVNNTYLNCYSTVDKKLPVTANDVNLNMFIVSHEYMAALEFRDNFHAFAAICKLINDIFQKMTNNFFGSIHFLTDTTHTSNAVESIKHENFHWNSKILCFLKLNELRTGNSMVLWTNLDEYLKTILKLSAKIALAHFHSAKILFVNSTDLKYIECKQTLEMVYSKIHADNNNKSWIKNNYLQNIIKVSKEYRLNLIITYNNILKVSNAHLITTNSYSQDIEIHLLNNDNVNDLILPDDK